MHKSPEKQTQTYAVYKEEKRKTFFHPFSFLHRISGDSLFQTNINLLAAAAAAVSLAILLLLSLSLSPSS